jgi:SNF2 family DNA or RNA helicase
MAKRLWSMGLGTGKSGTDVIWVKQSNYDPDANASLKANLPGPARWNGDEKRFEFPVHWDACTGARRVADKFDVLLRIAPSLREWAEVEKARQATIPDVQSMELVDLPAVREGYPALWEAITSRPFQTVGAAFAARNRSCLIADQPGLGKTLQSIAAVIESGRTGPILVVAPKSAAKLTWPQELARWVPGDLVYVLGSHLKAAERVQLAKDFRTGSGNGHGRKDGKRIWLITSPHYVRIRAEVDDWGKYMYENGKKIINPVGEAVMELFDVKWSAVIVDESHQTLAGARGNKKKQSSQRLGLGALDVIDGGLRIALSGTPFRGKEEYLWGQLNWLRPDLYRSFWQWIKDHFDCYQDRYGMTIGRMVDAEGMYREASSVMIRRTKDEVAKDLPAKQYGGWPLEAGNPESPIAVWLDMEPKQGKAYRDMVKHAAAELEGGTLLTNGILAELTRLKQFAGSYGKLEGDKYVPILPSNKFDWTVEFLDERGITDKYEPDAPKVVIASQFAQLINCFAGALKDMGIEAHVFTGATSDKDRERIKDDWQNNPESHVRVLLLTTTAGGVSLTLDAADDLIILDETWNTSDQEQLEDRLHRLSRMHQVTIWKVFSRDTIEESIAVANLGKEYNIKSIIDGERGIPFAKQMVGG